VASLLVPHRIDYRRDWEEACTYGGVIFERCRMTELCRRTLDPGLAADCKKWTRHVIERVQRT